MARRGGIRRAGGRRLGAVRRRMWRRGGIRRGLRQPVQMFKRSSWTPAGIVADTGSPYFNWSYTFSLNSIPLFTEFQALYDQYKIKAVKITLFPKFSQSDGASAANPNSNNLPAVMSVLDYDGGLQPGPWNPTTLVQYQNLKVTRGNKLHSRYLKPRVLNEIYNTAVTSGYGVSRNIWLDTTSSSIPHYGVYGIVDMSQVGVDTRVVFDVKIDYYLAFKNVR